MHTLGLRSHLTYERGVASAIQGWLKCPALVSVTISCNFRHSDDFLRIWDGCSHTIKNLSYDPGPDYDQPDSPDPGPGGSGRIKLESFSCTKPLGVIRLWLQDPRCPFDISGLKALQCNDSIGGAFGDMLAPSLPSIEVLFLISPLQTEDISRFCRLQQLELGLAFPFHKEFAVIRTICPEHRYRLEALQLNVSVLNVGEAEALAPELCQLQRVFSHLKTVHVLALGEPTDRTRSGELLWRVGPEDYVAFRTRWPGKAVV